jgi:hypothetical protein
MGSVVMKWLLLLALSNTDHPITHPAYETEALCEAAGEEIKARVNEKRLRIDYLCVNTNQPPVWPMR